MLITLHAWMVSDPGSQWAPILMILHYGLFLAWQPIWHGEQRLSLNTIVLFVLGGVVLLVRQGWWLRAFWLAGLLGLLGGRVFSARAKAERYLNLVAVGYLFSLLLLWVEPHLLGLDKTITAVHSLVVYGLPLVPLGVMMVKTHTDNANPTATLDFFYSLLLVLLTLLLVMGSFIIVTVNHNDYAIVVMQVMFTMAGLLFTLSWLWNPRSGFAGFGEIFSKYLLSVGLPFEQWLQRIAILAETTSSASQFLNSAVQELSNLTWVSGGVWHAATSGGNFGKTSPFKASLSSHGLRMTIYSKSALSPALTLHIILRIQLLGEFYDAQLREEKMQSSVYLQAVYETGARLTHDIKNLLQSLKTLCIAAESAQDKDQEKLLALMKKQLPQLSQRLQITLDKLRMPEQATTSSMNANSWWVNTKHRYKGSGTIFDSGKIESGAKLPAELFDNVVDNLLQNALEKKKQFPDITISAKLENQDGFMLSVEDTGEAIPKETAGLLFTAPLTSASGLGIGLYQASKMAIQFGYELKLTANENGCVRLTLQNK